MTYTEVLAHFGNGNKFKIATGIAYGNLWYWQHIGCIPLSMQFRIEDITKGELKARIEDAKPRD